MTVAIIRTHSLAISLTTPTVVPSHECITVRPSLRTIDILLSLLQRNVHVAIHRLKLSYINKLIRCLIRRGERDCCGLPL